jgi:hypothetical protein
LAISVVTAGATAGAGEALNLGQTAGAGTAANPTGSLTSSSLKIGQHAKQIAVNSTIGAGVETVINGDGFDQFGQTWTDRAITGAHGYYIENSIQVTTIFLR